MPQFTRKPQHRSAHVQRDVGDKWATFEIPFESISVAPPPVKDRMNIRADAAVGSEIKACCWLLGLWPACLRFELCEPGHTCGR